MIPHAVVSYSAEDARVYKELQAAAKTPEQKLRLRHLEMAMGLVSTERPPSRPVDFETPEREVQVPLRSARTTRAELAAWKK